ERVRALGLDGLLLDMDSTLKDYQADDFSAAVVRWVQGVRSDGIRLCILSNGRTRRVARLAGMLDVPFVAGAFKPLTVGCHAALRKMSLQAARTALVGDQIFADVLAGRLAGLFTILVRPTDPQEPWFTRVKRPLERQLL